MALLAVRRTNLFIIAFAIFIAAIAPLATARPIAAQETTTHTESDRAAIESALLTSPNMRGAGQDREMLLRGRVLDVDGQPARDFELTAKAYKSHLGRDDLSAQVAGNEFEVWVPIGGSHWFYIELTAAAKNGAGRAFAGIGNRELRQAAIEGVDLQLAPADREVKISVTHDGAPVAGAHVAAQLSGNAVLQSKSDKQGKLTFRLGEDEQLSQLTAWTDDFRIGGFSFNRKPRRDPLGEDFTIELDNCRDQTVCFLNAADNSPVTNLPFELVLGTGAPNYNFAAVPATLPHCRMTTNDKGGATFRWFPDWETHQAYVEISDPHWATAVENHVFQTTEDGALVMPLKRRAPRKPLLGKVTSDRFDVGGLLVEIKSFQGEEEGRSDHVYAFTDETGAFTADCLPGATYTVCVNDGRMASNMIDLIPYEPDTGQSNIAMLAVSPGRPVEIRVTAGLGRAPMRNQRVYVRQVHDFTWLENGKVENGSGARDYPVYTDDSGIARARALAGVKLRVTVYAGDWRSEETYVTVKGDEVTRLDIHRAIDVERAVSGRLLAPPNHDVDLAGAEIIYGSIDGETDERETIAADAQGRFAFKTKAIQLGIFAYTKDGQAAGVARPENLDGPIEIRLAPTMDLHGQLLDKNNEPLAHHGVRVNPRVSGKQDFNKSFATSFETKAFETTTDADGNYTLKNLPTEFDMTVRADPIDGAEYDAYVEAFYLVAGEQRPRMVSRLGGSSQLENRTLAQRYGVVVRDAKLGGFRVLVLCYDAESDDFVNKNVLNRDANGAVDSFLNLRIAEDSLAAAADRKFAASKYWPPPTAGKVFVAALDASGKELGHIELDVKNASAAAQAAEFLQQHAPPQVDAQEKWDAAFAEAERSGRRVWARVSQRYCGPCFLLSRWLDDNRELLERDYVFLKVDNVRDKHGSEIAARIVSSRDNYGVPFHAIFAADQQMMIDSESPAGNIGHPASFEGRRHVAKMLQATRTNLTNAEIEQILATLEQR